MKVITFSRQFPKGHPRAGEPTQFVEKIWQSIYMKNVGWEGFDNIEQLGYDIRLHDIYEPKHHTIRAGKRWKLGEQFSPRVWTGRPYASKQLQFAPPITINKIWNFQLFGGSFFLNGKYIDIAKSDIPNNDGLAVEDFQAWFDIHPKKKDYRFEGQVLCWDESVKY